MKESEDCANNDTVMNMDKNEYYFEYVKAENQLNNEILDFKPVYDSAMVALSAAVSFYQAEWCGVVTADFEGENWTPFWWFSKAKGYMADTRLLNKEIKVNGKYWFGVLDEGCPKIISEIESYKEIDLTTYELFKFLEARNVMVIPFDVKNRGLLILKNAERYAGNIAFLQSVLTRLIPMVNEQMIINSLPMEERFLQDDEVLDKSLNPDEMIISLLGRPKIRIGEYSFTEAEIESKLGWPIAAYLTLHGNSGIVSRKLSEVFEPFKDLKKSKSNISGTISRFNRKFEEELKQKLIISNSQGYFLNPEFKLQRDIDIFEQRALTAQNISNTKDRIKALENACNAFRGRLYESHANDFWIYSFSHRLDVLFTNCIDELLKLLHEENRLDELKYYATQAVEMDPSNVDYKSWLYVALVKTGSNRAARDVKDDVNDNMEEDDYESFMKFANEMLDIEG